MVRMSSSSCGLERGKALGFGGVNMPWGRGGGNGEGESLTGEQVDEGRVGPSSRTVAWPLLTHWRSEKEA